MFFGFNTNGLAHHAFTDAASLLSRIGYEGIAVTLDHDLLERRGTDFFWRTPPEEIRWLLESYALKSVVETGARFLLNPWKKHSPNLLDPEPAGRLLRRNYYFRAIELASLLRSDCVSIWSGAPADPAEAEPLLFRRLSEELRILADFASERSVRLAFEPEPGMMIDSMTQFERLLDLAPPELCLTLDVGHLFCQCESIPYWVHRQAERLVNVHFEDSVRGVHEHLFPGTGGIDFPEFFRSLREISYSGGVFVELSRQSAAGTETAQKAFAFLAQLTAKTKIFD